MEPMTDALTSDTNPMRLQCCPTFAPLTVSAQKKDLGKCFLSPLLVKSTEGGTRTLTPLRELDFEADRSVLGNYFSCIANALAATS